jgi:hypothetical protein
MYEVLMDIFKKFLDDTIQDSKYKYERVENLAEIYSEGDVVPIATVEYKRSYGMMFVHFRLSLPLAKAGDLTKRMTLADSCLVFEDDFFIHEEYGYLYGDEARQAFINRLKQNIEEAQADQETKGAFYISHNPIVPVGSETRTKYEKMWDESNE